MWELIQTTGQLNEALQLTDQETQAIVIDTETNGLRPYSGSHIIGVSWYLPDCNRSFYAPFRHEHKTDGDHNLGQDELDALITTFNRCNKVRHVYFNALFDLHMLANEGYIVPETVEDLMIGAQLAYENEYSFGRKYGLKFLSGHYLSTDDYDPVAGEKELEEHAKALGVNAKSEMYKMPPSAVAYYACMDVILTWQLREFYLPVLEKWGQTRLYDSRNNFLRLALYPMELNGFKVDVEQAKEYLREYTPRMDSLQAKYPDINISSPTKLVPYLRKKGIIHGMQSDKVALVDASLRGHKMADDVLEYRHLQKQNGFYKAIVDKQDDDGVLRTHYNVIGTNTGRISAYDPNPQQFPGKRDNVEAYVKKCFLAPEGYAWVQWDYSQMELRIASHYAEQQQMLERYHQGIDQHQATADMLTAALGIEMSRKVGKAANFGLLYGMGARKAVRQWSVQGVLLDLDTAKQVVRAWNENYPEFYQARWLMQRMAKVPRPRPDGSGEGFNYIQYPYNGRTRKFHEYKWWADLGYKPSWSFDYETSKAWNSLIQGTGAGVCEDGILRTVTYFRNAEWFKPMYTVHDSFGALVPIDRLNEVVPQVTQLMSDMTTFDVPLPVEAEVSYTTWYDLKEWTT